MLSMDHRSSVAYKISTAKHLWVPWNVGCSLPGLLGWVALLHESLIFLPGPKGEPENILLTLKAEVEGNQPYVCTSGLGVFPASCLLMSC